MMVGAIIAVLALLGGDPPQPSQAWREIKAANDAAMANDPCVRREGDGWVQLRWRDCLKFGPQRKMQGVWYDGFEESGFLPNVATVPLTREFKKNGNPEFETYLDIDRVEALRGIRRPQFHRCTHAIAIEFIGRRSLERGAYYTGSNDEVIVVDKVISVRFLGVIKSIERPDWEKRDCTRG